MRSVLLAGALTAFIYENAEALALGRYAWAPRAGFVLAGSGTAQIARKRQREWVQRPGALWPTSSASQSAVTGTFIGRAHGEVWVGSRLRGHRRRDTPVPCHAADGRATMISIHFEPPQMDDLAEGFGRAAVWGLFGALVPAWTRERLLEKEAGLMVDDAAELEALEEEYEEEYECSTCGNSSEVECVECSGKGFFVSASAQPRKCAFCDGLGTLECPECAEYREEKRRARRRSRIPLRLPPSTEDDFPFFPFDR